MSVVVGVDGVGRTRRLDEISAAHAGPVVRVSPPGDLPVLPDGGLVLVDDAHRLTDEQLRSLTAAARSGQPLVVARRPTIHSVALADLDEVAARTGAAAWTAARERAARRLVERGRLVRDGSRLLIPKAAWLFSDGIIAELL